MRINPRVFWMNVKKLRINNEWSQAKLATKLNLDSKTYSNKERTSPKVSMDLAQKIAEVLRTTVEELAAGQEPEEPLYDPEIKSFFDNVRRKRDSLGINQIAMAKLMGMSPTNWSTKESGKISRLPSSLVQQIVEVLGCSIEELRGENEAVKPPVLSEDRVIEKSSEIVTHCKSSYDISHLEEDIQKFISKKENKKIVEDLVKDFALRQYLSEK